MNKWNLTFEGTRTEVWVMQNDVPGERGKFVARFKYARARSSARHFAKFLQAHFTPAEYFRERHDGGSPLGVLEAKGYISLNRLAATVAK